MSARSFSRYARAVAIAAVVLAVTTPATVMAFESPNQPSSGGLVEEPRRYDGTVVTFEGEAVGEAMVRGDHAWVHLNDDAYMYRNVEEGAPLEGYNSGMPVWIAAEKARLIGIFGDYKHEGDIVRVTGTYNAACAQHGGDMDIHATDIKVLTPGRRAIDPIHPWKLALAIGLTTLAAAVWWAERRAGLLERMGLPFRR